MPPIDYNPLRNRIRDLGLTQKECAEKIGISEGQLCQKMAGNYEFRQSERYIRRGGAVRQALDALARMQGYSYTMFCTAELVQ